MSKVTLCDELALSMSAARNKNIYQYHLSPTSSAVKILKDVEVLFVLGYIAVKMLLKCGSECEYYIRLI